MSKLIVIYGCMFAGKTTKLIDLAKSVENQSEVFVIKHSFDNRYCTTNIVSHTKEQYPAYTAKKLLEIDCELYNNKKFILIDEAQFFDDIVDFIEKIRNDNITLIIAGLDLTYQRTNFGRMESVIKIANEKIQLTAICEICKDIAYYTRRIDNMLNKEDQNKIIVIGAEKLYQPVCENCFINNEERPSFS